LSQDRKADSPVAATASEQQESSDRVGSAVHSASALSHKPEERADFVRLRVEYWTKRLDHTLTHTQTSSRLIYLVDGAVLALVYFWLQTFGTSRQVILVAFLPTVLLAILNVLHARTITIQHSWYSGIDAKLRSLLHVEAVEHAELRRFLASTHGIYRAMHWAIAAVLLLAALGMLLYGWGWFQELPQRSAQDFHVRTNGLPDMPPQPTSGW
jgi:hypothetical protein